MVKNGNKNISTLFNIHVFTLLTNIGKFCEPKNNAANISQKNARKLGFFRNENTSSKIYNSKISVRAQNIRLTSSREEQNIFSEIISKQKE